MNHLINVAVAEKVSALRTEDYFAERAARGDLKKALRVLKRAGKGNPPLPGDELPVTRARRRRSLIDLWLVVRSQRRHAFTIRV